MGSSQISILAQEKRLTVHLHTSMTEPRTVARSHPARGISLYTLLAAVVVLGLIGSVLVSRFTGDQSKQQAAGALMRNLGQAVERFHLDTSCYPSRLEALARREDADQYNTCGRPLRDRTWKGPYVNGLRFNSRGRVITDRYIASGAPDRAGQEMAIGFNTDSGLQRGAVGTATIVYLPTIRKEDLRPILNNLGPGFVGIDMDGPGGSIGYKVGSR